MAACWVFGIGRFLAGAEPSAASVPAGAQVQNRFVRCFIAADGTGVSFVDRRTGVDYGRRDSASPFAVVTKGGRRFAASRVGQSGDRITIDFGGSGIRATLKATPRDRYLLVEVVSVSDEKVDELLFVDIPLRLRGSPDEPFAACALALNLRTNVSELPGATGRLRAACYPRFGLAGAAVAVVGCPPGELRQALKDAVSDAPDLPHSPLGGPWALDAPINQGSYLFNFGDLSEKTVDQWIEAARAVGMNQIDFHGGSSFRFGDLRLNPDTYPRGLESLKAVIDRLHAANIAAGLHTYSFFLDKASRWVTPVPDPRLAKDATFTLAEPLTDAAATVSVEQTTEKMHTTTGFFVWNSVILQIDDELITYAGVSKELPYAFTGCKRGAFGTRAAPHAKGAKVHHLKECFGLLVPDGDSTLFTEVAARTAELFNDAGFDMIYLDALDGEGILGGPDAGWYYGSKFVYEIWKRLKRPALMEMSTFHHHLWVVRSRYCAWDHPNRAHKKFIDLHVAANNDNRRIFMPGHLGWWAVKTWSGSQTEPTYADDIEYLCCKCLGTDTGFSVMGVDPTTIKQVPAFARLAPIMRQYEDVRRAGKVPDSLKARLRLPGEEFTLVRDPDGGVAFRPMLYARHKVEAIDGWSNTWKVANRFARQPLRLRIEALCGVGPYDADGNPAVAAFRYAGEFAGPQVATGMVAELRPTFSQVKTGGVSGAYEVTSSRPAPPAPTGAPDPTWTVYTKNFSPPLDLSKHPALGLWVYGDAQGEVLNIQLKSPAHISTGIRDHYIVVDFRGWRYFELLEPEGERCDRYAWPYSGSAYALYREIVDSRSIETLGIWCNNVPAGKSVTCLLSPIRAVTAFDAKYRNLSVTIGGRTVTFPVTMETGSYLELRSPTDCKLYARDGKLLSEVKPQGDVPVLEPGENEVTVAGEPSGAHGVRANVTIIAQGEPITE